MSHYLDIVVAPVPKDKVGSYRKEVQNFLNVCREYGALSAIEVEGDDVPVGKLTSFPRSLELKSDEAVFVALMTYRDRAHRDEVSAKMMADPRIADLDMTSMSFDPKRMYFGGFKSFVGTIPVAPAVQPYLFYRGRCEEAIEAYKANLGAEVVMLLRFKDAPASPSHGNLPAEMGEKIMHAAIRIHDTEILMSDGMNSGPLDFSCMSLTLTAASVAEAEQIFSALAIGGKVHMPLAKSFFALLFGAVEDKFGVSWMVIVPEPAQA